MTDVSKQILEKAHGGLKLNPDEQRRFLGTFEERVLGYADLETADDDKFQKGFLTILETFKKETEPLFVKISPQVEFDKQVFYLNMPKMTIAKPLSFLKIITLLLLDWLSIAMFRFKQVKKTSEKAFFRLVAREREQSSYFYLEKVVWLMLLQS